jgi:histidine decarboxylase
LLTGERTLKLGDVIRGAVGPFENYCHGYSNPGSSGNSYIAVLTLNTGKAMRQLSEGLDRIIAYDSAEANGVYVGQINMIIASSFCGLAGAIWGYDLVRDEKLHDAEPLWTVRRHDNAAIPVYSCKPLLDAGLRLFGTNTSKRFPLAPGAHVICAAKWDEAIGPCYVWCAIALAIAENRDVDSCLFLEDKGHFAHAVKPDEFKKSELEKMADAVVMVGRNQNVHYREIFVGFQYAKVEENEVGCALAAAPYVVLARRVIPASGPESLADMTLSEWEHAIGISSPAGKQEEDRVYDLI